MSIKKFGLFSIIIGLSLVLSGCSTSGSYSYENDAIQESSIEPTNLAVSWFDESGDKNYECIKFWTCVFVEVKAQESCPAIVANFEISNFDGQVLVPNASSYGSSLNRGQTAVLEIGFNNAIKEQVFFSFPTVTCTEPLMLASWETGMYNFPVSYCDPLYPDLCSQSGIPAQEWNNIGSYTPSTGSVGDGVAVVCNDGWVSYSGGKQGACSHHGGVAD